MQKNMYTSIAVIIELCRRDDSRAVGQRHTHLQRHVGPQNWT
jgi:hypothetical protein